MDKIQPIETHETLCEHWLKWLEHLLENIQNIKW